MKRLRRNAAASTALRRALGVALSAVAILGAAGAYLAAAPAQADGPTPDTFEVNSLTARITDEADADYTAAAGRPFEFRNQFILNNGNVGQESRDAVVTAPPGFLGNPAAFPRCPLRNIAETDLESDCPPGSKIGFVVFDGLVHPLFNVIPEHGYPAQFAFEQVRNIVSLYANLLPRTHSYRLSLGATNIPQGSELFNFVAVLYGAPFKHGSGTVEAPFLSNPLDCSEAEPTFDIAADSWLYPGSRLPDGLSDLSDPNWKTLSAAVPAVTGCDNPALISQWHPALSVKPLQSGAGVQADAPSGLAVDLDFPQSNDPTDLDTTFEPAVPQAPEPKDITVKLPAGLSISPSSADGLGACSDQVSDPGGDQVHYDTTKPVACPDASKIGSATAISPTLAAHDPVTDAVNGPEPIPGDLYLLKPHPGDLPIGGGNQEGKFRFLLQLENPRYGINVKLPGTATADPQTGQLTATFAGNPQLPASHITVNLKPGARAPLASPVTCGKFTSTSDIVPWTTPGTPDATPTADFSVTQGPSGSPCPASPGARPFSPAMSAGTESGAAGQSSPFVLHIARADGEQELSSLEVTLSKGLAAKFAGIPYCSDAALAAAATRLGKAEQTSPSCPASRIGSVTVGAGPGANPFYAQGNAYLAGPYKGAPMSVAVVTPAVAGPFDLGTVVVRNALYVDPETAQGRVVSDPFPKLLDGVPLRLRSIDVNLDRPSFTLNPTNCSPLAIDAKLISTDGATANPSNRFQASACDKLGFKPDLKLSLKGGTKRSKHPALKATLTYPKGNYANIAKAVVSLPHSEFLAQNHIKTICTRVQFAADACPTGSIYGYATATTPLLEAPLSGPVYLRSSTHPLPDLVAALHGQIDVDLVGRIDSFKGGIRTTFDAVPDAPVSKFVLTMQGGKKGLLENSKNLCASVNKADVAFTAQNGKTSNSTPVLTNSCKKSKGAKKGKSGKAKAHKRTIAWLPGLGF